MLHATSAAMWILIMSSFMAWVAYITAFERHYKKSGSNAKCNIGVGVWYRYDLYLLCAAIQDNRLVLWRQTVCWRRLLAMASESDPFLAFSDKEENSSVESLPVQKHKCSKLRWRPTILFHVGLVVLYSAITVSVLLFNGNSCRTIYTDGRFPPTWARWASWI